LVLSLTSPDDPENQLQFLNLYKLKVLSSEIEPAEIRFIRYVKIKSEARRFLDKSARPPCCERLLNYSAVLYGCWLFGKKLPRAHTDPSVAFYIPNTAVGNGTINKFGICFKQRNEHFKPRM
jgi:hypothetical protein